MRPCDGDFAKPGASSQLREKPSAVKALGAGRANNPRRRPCPFMLEPTPWGNSPASRKVPSEDRDRTRTLSFGAGERLLNRTVAF